MPTPEEQAKAAADAKAAEEAKARAAADAQKSEELKRAAAQATGPEGDFVVTGSPGGTFTIRGNGFTAGGTVSLNGAQLATDEWGDERIHGKLPADAKSGEVVVKIDESNQKRGYLRV